MTTTNTVRAGLPVVLVAGLLLAACGGGQGATPSSDARATDGQSTDAAAAEATATTTGLCALAPMEQVELALGGSTDGGIGDESSIFGGETCRFTLDDEHVLDISVSEQSLEEWREAIESVGLTDEVVEGVGEEAYRAPETALGGPGARFTAWADGREVGVTIYSDVDQETTFAAAQAIAEAVLAAWN